MPAKSKKQLKFMQAVANNPEFAKKVGVPTKVGKEFVGKKKGGEIKGKELQRLLEKERRSEPGLEGFYPEEYLVIPGKALKAGSVLLDAGLEKAQASGLFKRGGNVKKYEKGGQLKYATKNEKLYDKLPKEYKEMYSFGEFVTLPDFEKAVLRSSPEGREVKIPERARSVKPAPKKGNPAAVMKKKGGKIGMGMTKNNYKTGGKVSSCSKRADGCAVKGKTKGRMV